MTSIEDSNDPKIYSWIMCWLQTFCNQKIMKFLQLFDHLFATSIMQSKDDEVSSIHCYQTLEFQFRMSFYRVLPHPKLFPLAFIVLSLLRLKCKMN